MNRKPKITTSYYFDVVINIIVIIYAKKYYLLLAVKIVVLFGHFEPAAKFSASTSVWKTDCQLPLENAASNLTSCQRNQFCLSY